MQQISYHQIDFVAEPVLQSSGYWVVRKSEHFSCGRIMRSNKRHCGPLVFHTDRLLLGDWMLLYSEIEHAVLFKPTAWWQGGLFLQITTATHGLQLFMRSRRLWKETLPFPVAKQEGKWEFEPITFWQRLRNAL